MTKPILSIVMPYYNRPNQLTLTLRTMELSEKYLDAEVIIFDDGSDSDKRSSDVSKWTAMNVKNFYYPKEEKTWKNPCYLFNEGFKKASGDIILIQNPECFHIGDIIKYAIENTADNYLIFSCKHIKEAISEKLLKIFDAPEYQSYLNKLRTATNGWYNHPKYNPTKYHFTSSISRKNLTEFGGFDLRYKDGYSFDDDEFLERMKRSPFPIVDVPSDLCFSAHQWHPCTHPPTGCKDIGWNKNHSLFINHTMKETGWRTNDT